MGFIELMGLQGLWGLWVYGACRAYKVYRAYGVCRVYGWGTLLITGTPAAWKMIDCHYHF